MVNRPKTLSLPTLYLKVLSSPCPSKKNSCGPETFHCGRFLCRNQGPIAHSVGKINHTVVTLRVNQPDFIRTCLSIPEGHTQTFTVGSIRPLITLTLTIEGDCVRSGYSNSPLYTNGFIPARDHFVLIPSFM